MAKGGLGTFRSSGGSDLPELPPLAGGFKIPIIAAPNVESFTDAGRRIKGLGDTAAGAAGGQMLYGDSFEKSAEKLGLFNVTQDAAIKKTNTAFRSFNNLNRNVKKATVGFADLNKYIASFGLVKSIAGGVFLGEALNGIVSGFSRTIEKVSLLNREFYFLNKTLQGPGAASIWSMMLGGQMAGLSAETTLGAVSSVGFSLRSNPGVAALISKLIGKDVTGTKAISGTTPLDIVTSLKNKGMPIWQAQQYGELAGVPTETFYRLWDNLKDVTDATAEQSKRLKSFGIDVEKTDSSFNELYKSLTRVGAIFEVLGTEMGSWLARNFATPALNEMAYLLNPSAGKQGVSAPQYPTTQDFRHKTPGVTAPFKTSPSFYSFANPKERMIHYYEGLGLTTDTATKLAYNNAMEVSGSTGDKINDRLVPYGTKTIKNSSAVEMINSTTIAQNMLQDKVINAERGAQIWKNTLEHAAYNNYMNKVMTNYNADYSANNRTQNIDMPVSHTTNITVNGNADMGVMRDAASILGKDSWEMSLRQAVRGDTFR